MLFRPIRFRHHSLSLTASAWIGIVVAASVGCAPEPEASRPTWPEGTAVVLDGEPIAVAAVDELAEALLSIDGSYTLPHRRRLVLTAVMFPRAFARAHPDRPREEARAEAERWREQLLANELQGPLEAPVTGNWADLGIEYWFTMRELEPDTWSEVVELRGRFAVIQVLARDRAARGGKELFRARFVEFTFVDRPETIGARMLDGILEIVDPAWEEIVPGYWKYELR